MSDKCTSGGIGLGTLVAAFVSWMQWHSIGWMLIHGFLGWFYLFFWAIGLTASKPF